MTRGQRDTDYFVTSSLYLLFCSIYWQRQPGKRAMEDDWVGTCTRRLEGVEATLALMQARPLEDRYEHWDDDVAWLQDLITENKDQL